MTLGVSQNGPRSYQPNRFSPYAIPSRSTFPPAQHTYHNSVPFNNISQGVEYQAYSGSISNTSWPRGSYQAAYPIQYEEDPAPPYSAQPPLYMLPPHIDQVS